MQSSFISEHVVEVSKSAVSSRVEVSGNWIDVHHMKDAR